MPKSEPFSIRVSDAQRERIMQILAASDNEYTKSDIISAALDCFFSLLVVRPSILEFYDPAKDKAVTQNE